MLFLLFLSLLAFGKAYDYTFGNYSLYYSESCYCDPENYMSRVYKAPNTGFVTTYSIYNKNQDVHGFVGYNPNQEAIVVAYRGTSDPQNWITNLDAILTDYSYCDGCEVHKGFYNAKQSVIADVLDQVGKLRTTYPKYTILVTGHSLGAAMATLTAADIVMDGHDNVRLFQFGSPRVGNTAFAEWYSSQVHDRNRVTHHKDMVPHAPMHERFTHISGEYYEPNDKPAVVSCEGYEDPDCSYQWSITSISDHLLYMDVVMGGDGCDAI